MALWGKHTPFSLPAPPALCHSVSAWVPQVRQSLEAGRVSEEPPAHTHHCSVLPHALQTGPGSVNLCLLRRAPPAVPLTFPAMAAMAPQDGFQPRKYFSIDRVFRNEAVDKTHLAEFHQIEGMSTCAPVMDTHVL